MGIFFITSIGPLNGTWFGEHRKYDNYSIKFNDLKKNGILYLDDDAYAFKYSLEDNRLFISELDGDFYDNVYYEVKIDEDSLTITDFVGDAEDDFFEISDYTDFILYKE